MKKSVNLIKICEELVQNILPWPDMLQTVRINWIHDGFNSILIHSVTNTPVEQVVDTTVWLQAPVLVVGSGPLVLPIVAPEVSQAFKAV